MSDIDITVRPVTSRKEKSQFLHLPWRLYRNDPNWVPPLRGNQKELVGYKPHPFYDDAEAQTFLAFQQGEPCGRISAIINHAHNRRYDEQRGFFGFFECIDDQQAAAALFDAARRWLAERGMNGLRGPMNPSMNYELGLLVDGFDSPPTFMMTYNPPYYEKLVEGYGLRKTQDLFSFYGHMDMVSGLDKKLEFIIAEATRRFDIRMRKLDTSRFDQEVRTFLDIYNQALGGTWGFAPLSEKEIDHLSGSLRRLIVPELTAVAEVEGRPVAVVFSLLDYNPRIKKIDGRLFPFGFIRLLTNRRGIKRARMVSTNVLPEFQRWGLGLVVLNGLLPDAIKWGIEEGEFSWVLESNHLSRASLERGGAKLQKTHRLYDLEPLVDADAS